MLQSNPNNSSPDLIHILLVEDHVDIALLLRLALERDGYHVDVAYTMQSAETLFYVMPFDLLISDIMLPDGTGWELMQRLTSSQCVKAIAISALATKEDVARSLSAGFACHLKKPMALAMLQVAITQVLSGGPQLSVS